MSWLSQGSPTLSHVFARNGKAVQTQMQIDRETDDSAERMVNDVLQQRRLLDVDEASEVRFVATTDETHAQ